MKATALTIRDQLVGLDRNVLVKFTRPFENGSVLGHVLAVGSEFFMVALVDDLIQYNGFRCFRLKDIRNLQVPAKYAPFVKTALRKRGERMPRKPAVSVAHLSELLVTSSVAFPLVTIHRERVTPEICHIGQVTHLTKHRVFLREIGPDACWDEAPESYALREITRVDFGGKYEEALLLVGGMPDQ